MNDDFTCFYCGKPVEGEFIGGDISHPACWWAHHPPRQVTSFSDLLCHGPDARQIVVNHVPLDLQRTIMEAFNTRAAESYTRRMARYAHEKSQIPLDTPANSG